MRIKNGNQKYPFAAINFEMGLKNAVVPKSNSKLQQQNQPHHIFPTFSRTFCAFNSYLHCKFAVCVCVRPCACVWMRFQMCVASHQLQRKLNERKKAVRYVYALWLTIFESLFCNWVNVVWWILVHQLVNVALSWCRFWIAKTTTTTKTVAPSICNNLSHLAARHRLNNHHIWKHRH